MRTLFYHLIILTIGDCREGAKVEAEGFGQEKVFGSFGFDGRTVLLLDQKEVSC